MEEVGLASKALWGIFCWGIPVGLLSPLSFASLTELIFTDS